MIGTVNIWRGLWMMNNILAGLHDYAAKYHMTINAIILLFSIMHVQTAGSRL
jgi:hypothetical protein